MNLTCNKCKSQIKILSSIGGYLPDPESPEEVIFCKCKEWQEEELYQLYLQQKKGNNGNEDNGNGNGDKEDDTRHPQPEEPEELEDVPY